MSEWIFCSDRMPPQGQLVDCQESTGLRFDLKRVGAAWAFADGQLFMGFAIVRWRPLDE